MKKDIVEKILFAVFVIVLCSGVLNIYSLYIRDFSGITVTWSCNGYTSSFEVYDDTNLKCD